MKYKLLLPTLILTLVCTGCKTTKDLLPGQEAISELNPAGESSVRTADEEELKKSLAPSR